MQHSIAIAKKNTPLNPTNRNSDFPNARFWPTMCFTVLSTPSECVPFLLKVSADESGLQAIASAEKSWAVAWERGIHPIQQTAVQSMKEDVWKMDPALAEDSSTFQAAMILLASELVGPWSDRIATFLGYPPALAEVVAARLYGARIWENDVVHCEKWFDPEKGSLAFVVDLMVAEGMLVRRWSEEDQQFAYRAIDMPVISRLAI